MRSAKWYFERLSILCIEGRFLFKAIGMACIDYLRAHLTLTKPRNSLIIWTHLQKEEIPMSRLFLSMTCTLLLVSLLGCEDSQKSPEVMTLFKAEDVITLSSQKGNSVVVKGDEIVEVGDFEALQAKYASQNISIDTQFEYDVFLPGFINQHDHPWLAAITMGSQVISFEDWQLPNQLFPKATNQKEYLNRLNTLVKEHKNKDELFLSWGYHELWHGKLTRQMLDEISTQTPIAIWQRSCHEFIINSKGLELFGINQTVIDGLTAHQQSQINLSEGHLWEAGLMAMTGNLFKELIKPQQYINSLKMIQKYWHNAGTTLVVEPGGLVNKPLSIMQNHVFSPKTSPFHMDYIADGKTMANQHMDTLLESTQDMQTWGQGMSRFYPKQVKLFSDGAVFSQLMKMSEGYLDGHHGEWIMQPELFQRAFAKYWDAGYQIHVHQNGDEGLDLVLDTLSENMKRNPREDHRTVIVHFSYSRLDQVAKIKELGAIVSVNPYYPVALADMYSKVGVGPQRSESMVRLGDLQAAGLSYSLHSDMPMAPGRPLYLMWCAVNRLTLNGNTVAPEQKISALQALRAVTIDAAYSMKLENQIGSIEAGKFANITVLKSNPLNVDPMTIKDIKVVATLHEGRVLMVQKEGIPKTHFWELIPVYWQLIMAKL